MSKEVLHAIAGRIYKICLVEKRSSASTLCGQVLSTFLWHEHDTYMHCESFESIDFIDSWMTDERRICPKCEEKFYGIRDECKVRACEDGGGVSG